MMDNFLLLCIVGAASVWAAFEVMVYMVAR